MHASRSPFSLTMANWLYAAAVACGASHCAWYRCPRLGPIGNQDTGGLRSRTGRWGGYEKSQDFGSEALKQSLFVGRRRMRMTA